MNENFTQALELLEHLLRNCKADAAALDGLKNRMQKARANSKANKGAIMQGLVSQATYGSKIPSTTI
ncbi:hypothetical protein [Niabella hibiscisoli]|uniref:hypothetical protein n=1 Tax=Niabella hibiscisoli TaxID=1825928 RepID=UPI001F0E958A|nr:hypothetical protein [Niabella hibiscisoli]MCH5715879.1 hypothetical protein [Niabella hibiscisoli]